MKKLVCISLLSIVCFQISAQVIYDYLKAADTYFAKADYASAAQYYEKYLGIGKTKIKGEEYDPYTIKNLSKQQKIVVSNKQQAIYKLAESFRLLNFHVKAAPYYLQATAFDKASFPLASYWYGKTLRALEKYDMADSVLTSFVTINDSASIAYIADAKREIANLKFIKAELEKNIALFTVNKATPIVNAGGANYAPVRINANTLWFTSTRKDSSIKANIYNNKVYSASYDGGVVGSVKKLAVAQAPQHQGIISFTPNGNTLFLTRWTITNGKKIASIYASDKVSDGWSEPIALDNTVNTEGASTQQPFVMPNGKQLLFATNRSEGLGGFDIWSVDLDDNGKTIAGTIKNLGPQINSSFDEQAPYFHAPSSSLIFSSNGNVGMGGFDFFRSKNVDGTNWSLPENLGYPLNSVKDDIYFTTNGTAKNMLADVLFSSDRSSDCCLEMFSLNKIRPIKKITGLVVDCETKQPIEAAAVSVTNSVQKVVLTTQTNASGNYNFEVEDFDNFTSSATANGYKPNENNTIALTNDELTNQSLNELCLTKIPPPPPPIPLAVDTIVVMDNIYFEFNKAILLEESHAAINNQILTMLNKYPTMVIEVGGHTDSQGKDEYNLKLSQARAESVKKYLIEKGISAERMEAKGYGESKPVAPNTINGNDNPEGRKKNRRTEFKVLHY